MVKEDCRYLIFSDGGGDTSSSAAGACLVRDLDRNISVRVVIFLDGGTNNEGEIMGGLLGFAIVRAMMGECGMADEPCSVLWCSDSEYVLKSATDYIHNWMRNGWKTATKSPVKNQGLWHTYLELSKGFSIQPQHVRGHSGHPENEECDSACTRIRQRGKAFLEESQITLPHKFLLHGQEWWLIDGRVIIKNLREDAFEAKEVSVRLCQAAREVMRLHEKDSGRPEKPASAEYMEDPAVQDVIRVLKNAQAVAEKKAELSAKCRELSSEIEKMILRFQG